MGFSIIDIDKESEYPNTHQGGNTVAKCITRVLRLGDVINLIDVRLKQNGPKWIETLARAIIFGWGEFLREMRSEIIKVTSSTSALCSLLQIRDNGRSHVDHFNDGHCWHLFEQRLILRETELLTRAVLALKQAREGGIALPLSPTNLQPSLNRIEKEVETDQTLIKDAIDMVTPRYIGAKIQIHNKITFQKVEISTASSNNMELLSVLAAFFLPLTLLTVLIKRIEDKLIEGGIRNECEGTIDRATAISVGFLCRRRSYNGSFGYGRLQSPNMEKKKNCQSSYKA